MGLNLFVTLDYHVLSSPTINAASLRASQPLCDPEDRWPSILRLAWLHDLRSKIALRRTITIFVCLLGCRVSVCRPHVDEVAGT
jgi:hypothetical protein